MINYLVGYEYSLSCRQNIERRCWDLRLDMTGFSSREEAEDLASVIRLGYAEEGVFSEQTSNQPSNDNDGWEVMDRLINEARLSQQDRQTV